MFWSLAKTLAVGVATVSVSAMSISTPEALTQCAPATFTWTPTTAPYYLSIVESHDDSIGAAQATFSLPDDFWVIVPFRNTATWMVDLPAGANVTIVLRDATGEIAETYPRVIGMGSDDCLEELVDQV